MTVYDSYVDQDDNLLYLVDYNEEIIDKNNIFWVSYKQIQASKVASYLDQIKQLMNVDQTCNSSKMLTLPCIKKNRTVGVFLGCYNCGIIASYKEIFCHETIAQAVVLSMQTIEYCEHWPRFLIYDDGCTFAKYVMNKASQLFSKSTFRAIKLAETITVVDRFHFKSHVDVWCKKFCDPDLYDELKEVNTSVCEETNFWFGRYKHTFKHMNYERFHFLLYILCDEYNKFKLIDQLYNKAKKK